jgi:hypothetical protein
MHWPPYEFFKTSLVQNMKICQTSHKILWYFEKYHWVLGGYFIPTEDTSDLWLECRFLRNCGFILQFQPCASCTFYGFRLPHYVATSGLLVKVVMNFVNTVILMSVTCMWFFKYFVCRSRQNHASLCVVSKHSFKYKGHPQNMFCVGIVIFS